jgi:hypothetical protein
MGKFLFARITNSLEWDLLKIWSILTSALSADPSAGRRRRLQSLVQLAQRLGCRIFLACRENPDQLTFGLKSIDLIHVQQEILVPGATDDLAGRLLLDRFSDLLQARQRPKKRN